MVDKFKLAMLAAGLTPPEVIEPGRLLRFATNGRKFDTSGWCRLFLDGRSGVFGDFRTGLSSVWAASDDKPATLIQRQQRADELKLARVEADALQSLHWARSATKNSILLAQTDPIQAEDPVARYLDGRGIHLKSWPQALRYHSALDYWQDGQCIGRFPAMVGVVTDPQGRMISLHRTYLTHDGRKANVGVVKKLTAASERIVGCSVCLGQPSVIKGEVTLAVAEGIETALACYAASAMPTVSAISALGMARYQWSDHLQRLIVFADNDANQVGQNAASALAKRARSHGVAVKVLIPPEVGTDWADVWAAQEENN